MLLTLTHEHMTRRLGEKENRGLFSHLSWYLWGKSLFYFYHYHGVTKVKNTGLFAFAGTVRGATQNKDGFSSLALAMLSLYFTLFSASNTRVLYCCVFIYSSGFPLWWSSTLPCMHLFQACWQWHALFFHTQGLKVNCVMLIPMHCSAWRILALLPGAMQIKSSNACNIPIHPSRRSLLHFLCRFASTAPQSISAFEKAMHARTKPCIVISISSGHACLHTLLTQ